MRHREVKALLLMMEALIRQLQHLDPKVHTLIDEAWKEFNAKERPAVLGGPKR